jgi:ketosteroid isomerase-like protein
MRLQSRIAPMLALAALAACGTPQSETPAPEAAPTKPAEVVTETPELDSGAVGLVRDRYIAAVNDGNLDDVMALWVDDGVLMPPDEQAVVGKEAIRAWYERMFSRFDVDADITSSETHIAGDWGFDRGSYTLSLAPKAPPAPAPADGSAPADPDDAAALPAGTPPGPAAADVKPAGPAQTAKYLVIVKRDEKSAWKVARNVWNFEAPPQRPEAPGNP